MNSVSERLCAIGLEIPDAPKPLGNFLPYVLEADYLYISGQIAIDPQLNVIRGKLGLDLGTDVGTEAARRCGIGILARAQAAVGNLERIEKVVKLGVFVNATDDFIDHPKVANGASDLMIDVFGNVVGAHVRFAVGVASLPSNSSVEIEAVFKIKND